ncbi:MAG: PilN domain-containing protein [Thermodesulfobacteriota bacterium]
MKAIHTNLATFEYVDRRLSLLLILSTSAVILLISVNTIRQFFDGADQIQTYQKKIYQKEQEIAVKIKDSQKDQQAITKEQIKSIEHQVVQFNRLIATDIYPWNRILEELERSSPAGLCLVSFVPADDFQTLTMKGRAESENRISFFFKRLEESKLFDGNTLLTFQVNPNKDSTSEGNGESGIQFTIESRLSRNGVFSDPYYRNIGTSIFR